MSEYTNDQISELIDRLNDPGAYFDAVDEAATTIEDLYQEIQRLNDQLSANKALEVREAFQIVANETGCVFQKRVGEDFILIPAETFNPYPRNDCVIYSANNRAYVEVPLPTIPGDGPLLIGPQT